MKYLLGFIAFMLWVSGFVWVLLHFIQGPVFTCVICIAAYPAATVAVVFYILDKRDKPDD